MQCKLSPVPCPPFSPVVTKAAMCAAVLIFLEYVAFPTTGKNSHRSSTKDKLKEKKVCFYMKWLVVYIMAAIELKKLASLN